MANLKRWLGSRLAIERLLGIFWRYYTTTFFPTLFKAPRVVFMKKNEVDINMYFYCTTTTSFKIFIIPTSSMHKQDFENISQSSIGSNAPPITTPTKEFHEFNNTTDVTCQSLETPAEQSIIQSTLVSIYVCTCKWVHKYVTVSQGSRKLHTFSLQPKARPASTLTSNNYSSLPCCGARSTSLDGKTTRGVSCNGERNKLGIDISAVHNAVLRGGLAKLPGNNCSTNVL